MLTAARHAGIGGDGRPAVRRTWQSPPKTDMPDTGRNEDMMDIQAEIADLFEDNGAYRAQRPAPPELIAEFQGKLPEFLLAIWKDKGFGSWANGLFSLCNPHDFKGLVSQIVHADKDLSHKDCHIFAHSAFGKLILWSERHGIVNVDLLNGRLSCPWLTTPAKKGNPDVAMALALSLYGEALQALNVYDENDKPLFARAAKKLGTPEPMQAFGFFPALAMGGARDLKSIKITPAMEYFLFLAQLQQFQLVDYLSQPPRIVRQIG